MKLSSLFKRSNQQHPSVTQEVKVRPNTPRQRFVDVARTIGSRAGELAVDANSAVTEFRCARLKRKLRRNPVLAHAAREALR